MASAIRSASSFKPEPSTTAIRGALGDGGAEHGGGLFGSRVQVAAAAKGRASS